MTSLVHCLHRVQTDLDVIDEFIEYVNSCLKPYAKKEFEYMAKRRDLGFNKKTKRIGVLLPQHIIEFCGRRLVLPAGADDTPRRRRTPKIEGLSQ